MKDWFLYMNKMSIGDKAPSGVCRLVADFTPSPCISGAGGDETASPDEAADNARLAVNAPRLLEALKSLVYCIDEKIPCEGAIEEARGAIIAASPKEIPLSPLDALVLAAEALEEHGDESTLPVIRLAIENAKKESRHG